MHIYDLGTPKRPTYELTDSALSKIKLTPLTSTDLKR